MANILSDFQAGQDFIGGLVQGRAKRQAGAKLAQRDYGGAAADLYGAGMLREGAAVQDAQDQQAENERQIAEEERRRHLEEVGQRISFFKQVAQGLIQVPADKRNEAFESFAPTLQAMGLEPGLIDQMRAAPKDDGTLNAFGAKLDDEWKFFSTSKGVVAAQPRTGEATLAYEAPANPLDDQLKAALIEQRQAQAARARRPPAPRSGGGRSLSSMSTEELIAALNGAK